MVTGMQTSERCFGVWCVLRKGGGI